MTIICQCRIITEERLRSAFEKAWEAKKEPISIKDLSTQLGMPKCNGCKSSFQAAVKTLNDQKKPELVP